MNKSPKNQNKSPPKHKLEKKSKFKSDYHKSKEIQTFFFKKMKNVTSIMIF